MTNATYPDKLAMICAADVEPEPVEWLWPGRVAIGKQTLIVGEAGLGKSQLAIAMVAAVTTGATWPCDEGRAPLGNVIILSAEDGAADTIILRLMAARANRERVHLVTSVLQSQKNHRSFNLQTDLELLEEKINEVGDVQLVVIDPISSYLGANLDSHVNASVRGVLEPIGEMAERLRVAILSITHPPKAGGTAAINRFIGSVAFVAAARAAFMVIKDADDQNRRRFVPVKNNLAPLGKGLAFRLEQRLVGAAGKEIVASSVVWEREPVTISADQALSAAEGSGGKPVRTEAKEFLLAMLEDGPHPVTDIKEEAKAAGLSWATVRRAKDELGIRSERESEGRDGVGQWLWRLQDAHSSAPCSSKMKSTLQENEHLAENDDEADPPEPGPIPDSLDQTNDGQLHGCADAEGGRGQQDDDLDIPDFLRRGA